MMTAHNVRQSKRYEQILAAIEESEHADSTVREVADAVGLPRSMAYSDLRELEERGAVRQTRKSGNLNLYALAEDEP